MKSGKGTGTGKAERAGHGNGHGKNGKGRAREKRKGPGTGTGTGKAGKGAPPVSLQVCSAPARALLSALRFPRRPGGFAPFRISRRTGCRRKRIFALLVSGVTSTDDRVIVNVISLRKASHDVTSMEYRLEMRPGTGFKFFLPEIPIPKHPPVFALAKTAAP